MRGEPAKEIEMKYNHRRFRLVSLFALIVLLGSSQIANAQTRRGFLTRDKQNHPLGMAGAQHDPKMVYRCTGEISKVEDVAFEGVKTTTANWAASPGGGDGGRYDKTPVLTTKITLEDRMCLNAHLSAIVGSRDTYGPSISRMTLFQVTLTPSTGGAPQHMIGHYDFPYGQYGPAVALSAEYDVDMLSANFFQRIGKEQGDLPPGPYEVNVWWAGGPVGGGGAIAADFVLKLYFRK